MKPLVFHSAVNGAKGLFVLRIDLPLRPGAQIAEDQKKAMRNLAWEHGLICVSKESNNAGIDFVSLRYGIRDTKKVQIDKSVAASVLTDAAARIVGNFPDMINTDALSFHLAAMRRN